MNQVLHTFSLLLAGGSGTRLWPVSRQQYPKQLVSFIGEDSLVQSTIKRLLPVMEADRIRVVCGSEHYSEIARHMEEIGIPAEGKLIGEPCGRNTAPAILLGVLTLLQQVEDAVICVFPADHVIRDTEDFHRKLKEALSLAVDGRIVTFGIRPHYPETGYGYIEGGKAFSESAMAIRRFVEKPDFQTAEKYLEAGNFFWNSGMFVFRATVILSEVRKYLPELLSGLDELVGKNRTLTLEGYGRLPDISIDYAVMERTDKGVVLPVDFGWSDIGSWKSLYDFLPKDDNANVIDGDVICQNTRNSFILGHERLIAVNNLENIAVIETPDSVFVSDLKGSREVKSIVSRLKEGARKEYMHHRTQYFPWGSTTLLERENYYTVERLIVYPKSTAVLPVPEDRAFRIVVLNGKAIIRGSGREQELDTGGDAGIEGPESLELENQAETEFVMLLIEAGRSLS